MTGKQIINGRAHPTEAVGPPFRTENDPAPFQRSSVPGTLVYVSDFPAVGKATVAIDAIYQAPEAGSIQLSTAIRLLPEAVRLLQSAKLALDAGEVIPADDAVMHLYPVIRELFCCRSLGDGFGTIVNAILSSMENQHGIPLEPSQVETMLVALEAIRNEPRLSFERAIGYVSRMEDVGLSVDPSGTDAVADLLSG